MHVAAHRVVGAVALRADDMLEAMATLWPDDEPSHHWPYVSFEDVAFGPKSIQQPRPRIWFGGDADPVPRRTAPFGDGWAPWLTPPADIPSQLDLLRSG
jgi:alkanesulfonate monooxygenase SsuD/methylene tetrahydromethanopterin reductase-like flavin-dependent oxidoreductase (luciferase family)